MSRINYNGTNTFYSYFMKYFVKRELDYLSEKEVSLKLYNLRTTLDLLGISDDSFQKFLYRYQELGKYFELRFTKQKELAFIEAARVLVNHC